MSTHNVISQQLKDRHLSKTSSSQHATFALPTNNSDTLRSLAFADETVFGLEQTTSVSGDDRGQPPPAMVLDEVTGALATLVSV